MLIVRVVSKTNALRQFEAGELRTVFPGCNAHDEKRAQLRLPLTDVIPEFEISAARGTELEKNPVGKGPHFIEPGGDCFPKRSAAFDRYLEVAGYRFSRKLSE